MLLALLAEDSEYGRRYVAVVEFGHKWTYVIHMLLKLISIDEVQMTMTSCRYFDAIVMI